MDAPPPAPIPKLEEGARVDARYVEPEDGEEPSRAIEITGEYRGIFVKTDGYVFIGIKGDDGVDHVPQLWQVERLSVSA
jgi:hypothetical protein